MTPQQKYELIQELMEDFNVVQLKRVVTYVQLKLCVQHGEIWSADLDSEEEEE